MNKWLKRLSNWFLQIENEVMVPFVLVGILVIGSFSMISYYNGYTMQKNSELELADTLFEDVNRDLNFLEKRLPEEEIAEKYHIRTTLLCDTNHVLNSDYSEVIVVGAGADAVDYKLISLCHKGDIVVSQDYGVAAMALGKGAYAIHQSGKWYTDANIDQMLMERHLNKKARRSSGKNHMKGPRKRTEEDDVRFAESFEKLVLKGGALE